MAGYFLIQQDLDAFALFTRKILAHPPLAVATNIIVQVVRRERTPVAGQ